MDEANGAISKRVQRACNDTLPLLISFSLCDMGQRCPRGNAATFTVGEFAAKILRAVPFCSPRTGANRSSRPHFQANGTPARKRFAPVGPLSGVSSGCPP